MIAKLLLASMIAMTGVTALAAANAKSTLPVFNPANMTVIEKNQEFPVIGTPKLERCAKEDCSDTET